MTALTEWIAAQRALEQKATKGPWRWREERPESMFPYGAVIAPDGCRFTVEDEDGLRVYRDIPFIAASRVTVPTALRLVEVLAARMTALDKMLDDAGYQDISDERSLIADALATCERIVGAEQTKEASGD